MLCLGGMLHRWCSGRRRPRPLCVPVGGGPPASRPRCELRSARRLEARPGPATAHGHRSLGLWPFYPVADADWCVGPAPPMGAAAMLAGLAVSSMPAGLGLAHCATVSKWAAMGLCSMRSWLTECRRRVGVSSSASPLRVAVRSRFAVVSCPKCRPPRRKTLKTGCYGRSGLRFERIGTCHSALLAREPAIASVNPLCRT